MRCAVSRVFSRASCSRTAVDAVPVPGALCFARLHRRRPRPAACSTLFLFARFFSNPYFRRHPAASRSIHAANPSSPAEPGSTAQHHGDQLTDAASPRQGPENAEGLPPGTYLGSCRGCSLDGTDLVCRYPRSCGQLPAPGRERTPKLTALLATATAPKAAAPGSKRGSQRTLAAVSTADASLVLADALLLLAVAH